VIYSGYEYNSSFRRLGLWGYYLNER
jgi:hypothetical protein